MNCHSLKEISQKTNEMSKMNVKSKIGVECTLDNETSGYFLTPEEYERVLSNERIIQN